MSLRMVIFVSFEEGEGRYMDDQWIRETASRIKKEIAAKRVKEEKFVETQRLKRELGPGFWGELRDWLKGACQSLNSEMGTEIVKYIQVSGNEVSVCGQGDGMYRIMTVRFDPSRMSVEYSSQNGDPSRQLYIEIGSDGTATLGEDKMSLVWKPVDIGKEIIKHALEVFSR